MTINNGAPIPAAYADEIAPREEHDVSTQTENPKITVSAPRLGLEAETTLNDLSRLADDTTYPVPEVNSEFAPADDLEELAEEILDKHQDRLGFDTKGAVIRYAWKQKGGNSKGVATLGKCVKLTGVNAYFADGADYLIWLARDHVKDRYLTRAQVEALLFHELCHIAKEVDDDGNETFKVAGHDVEMFRAEVEEYGLWKWDLELAAKSFRQLELEGVS